MTRAAAQTPVAIEVPAHMHDDAAAVWLAMRCAEGGETARPALVAALDRLGWAVKDKDGRVLRLPQLAKPTGLALREHELEMLFWNQEEQPAIRLISYAQTLAVLFPTADAEDLAQGLLDSIRSGAESDNPQRRFWARFIIALGMAQGGNDLTGPGDPHVIMPHASEITDLFGSIKVPEENPEEGDEDEAAMMRRGMATAAAMMQAGGVDLGKLIAAANPQPAWPTDDPVLAPSPISTATAAEKKNAAAPAKSPDQRLNEVVEEMGSLYEKLASDDPRVVAKTQDRLNVLQMEMQNINQGMMHSSSVALMRALDPDAEEDEDDGDSTSGESRFLAEHRGTPLSLLQIVLLTRVVVADVLGEPPPATGIAATAREPQIVRASLLPIPLWQVAQAPAGGPPTTFTGQVASAGADLWATGWGAYTGGLLDKHLPGSAFGEKFGGKVSIGNKIGLANAIMGWVKTLTIIAANKIVIEVENAPLVRTKTRTAGEQRRAKCNVIIDIPKTGDALKALRAAGNIAGVDIQVAEGGPVSGAKVVWRLPEGSYNGKYATKGGGSTYRPDLAVVQFEGLKPGAKGTSAYVSYTDDNGDAFISIEGAPQRKTLGKDVREQPRRAKIAVEVTMKVGNLIQDINDVAGAATGSPGVIGVINFISEMLQRTSFLYQKGRAFEVTDWAPPAWEGEIVITVNASGSKSEKLKQGPPAVYQWKMSRAMEARLQSPEWDQEEALEKAGSESDVSILEISNDTKRYKVADASSQSGGGTEAAFTADGPVEIQQAGRNQLQLFSRAEPSGYGRLHTWPDSGQYQINLEPFFSAKAQIFNYERSKGRSHTENRVGPYDLLQGVHPNDLTDSGTYDPKSGMITGSKTIEARGSLPHVPGFDATIEFAYTLRYNAAPPPNKR